MTEVSNMQNFNFGFATHKSDVLVHLSQWQYWWWFWFSLVWTLYFFFILTLVQRRTFQFNPIINTSIRGHGKWGDFLVAIIPLSWCGNILVNSNFILRMIEWQNESSLFTIRVQGKQWYWVYKYDATAAQAILAAPKNIGHNRWFVRTPTESLCADSYYQALQLGAQLEFNQLYLKFLNDKQLTKQVLTTDNIYSQSVQTSDNSLKLYSNSTIKNYNMMSSAKELSLAQVWDYWYITRVAKDNYYLNSLYTSKYSGDKLKLLEEALSLKKRYRRAKDIQKNFADRNSYLKQPKDLNVLRGHASTINKSYESLNADNISPSQFKVLLREHMWRRLRVTYTLKDNTVGYAGRYSLPVLRSLDNYLCRASASPRTFAPLLSKYLKMHSAYDVIRAGLIPSKDAAAVKSTRVVLGVEQQSCAPLLLWYYVGLCNENKAVGGHFENLPLEDTQDFSANKIELTASRPLRIAKGVLNVHNFDVIKKAASTDRVLKHNILFVPQFEGNAGELAAKPDHGELLWGFKQKKYKRVQKFKYTGSVIYDPITFAPISTNNVQSRLTLKSNVFTSLAGEDVKVNNAYDYQRAIKYNRHRSELVPVTLARRLLRTKRTLVLPAHTNITVITNSYDVVHSWFIPGLGIKLDCVPGRSTHHTFYIDNIGFYYGQCAEICGRYHHHMPIRLCALPFEQFLVWWQRKGLKRMHRVTTIKNASTLDSNQIKFRYQW